MREKKNKNIEWATQFESVKTLFDRLAVKKTGSLDTQRIYARGLQYFHEFSGLTPDDIVNQWKKEASEDYEEALENWDVKLDKYMKWLMEKKGQKKSSAAELHTSIKALVKYNSRLKMAIGSPSKGLIKAIQPITLDELKDMDAVADEQQRFIVRALKDTGMSRKDFVALNYSDVRKDLERGESFVHVHCFRRKEEVEYDTFMGVNAVESLKIYLRIRKSKGEVINDDTPLVVSQKTPYVRLSPNDITQIVDRVGHKIGLKASPHRLRKTFESYMALEVRHPIILKYWMGHKLASDIEARYVLPPIQEQKALYQKAYKAIDLNEVASMDEMLKTIEQVKEALPPELREKAVRLGVIIRQKKEFSKDLAKKVKTETNGGDCGEEFEQVKEEELLSYLRAGWRIECKVGDAEYIVKR